MLNAWSSLYICGHSVKRSSKLDLTLGYWAITLLHRNLWNVNNYPWHPIFFQNTEWGKLMFALFSLVQAVVWRSEKLWTAQSMSLYKSGPWLPLMLQLVADFSYIVLDAITGPGLVWVYWSGYVLFFLLLSSLCCVHTIGYIMTYRSNSFIYSDSHWVTVRVTFKLNVAL